MRNKLLILLLSFLFINSIAVATTFNFEAKNLEIMESGNLITADEGKAVSSDNNLYIESDKFEYIKDLDILKTYGNGSLFIKSKNFKINFDNAVIDQKKLIIEAQGNIIIYDLDNKFEIQAEKMIYNQKNFEIKTIGKVILNQSNKELLIESSSITYNEKESIIKSENTSVIKDNQKNIYYMDSFFYEIDKNILKVENLIFKDYKNNNFQTSLAYINVKTGKLFGKDINLNLNNTSFNPQNEPRLKGNSIINEEETSEITKGVFTTCKRRDGCPPWKMSAELIQHDKKNKIINYKNAFLSIYDIPVMYFPRFFHPDPTVKRKSGFLIPSIKNSSSDNYLSVPYFFAIANNKDATFTPRFYTNDKILFQNEYRQVNLDSDHFVDFSFFGQKGDNSKNHIFYEYNKDLNSKDFELGKMKIKFQKTSNDTYLKKNKIKSTIISDNNILENSLGFDLYSNDLSIDVNTTIYEDLDKNNNDRFEYILPKIDITKKLNNNTKFNGDIFFNSQNLIRNYNTNITEKSNINNLNFVSNPTITENGFYNNYEFSIKNSNTKGENSEIYKESESIYLSTIFQYNSSLPLIKENSDIQKIFKPKFSIKLAPSHTRDVRNKDFKIDVNNIYSLNRAVDNDTVEGGMSLAYGSDYSVFDKKNSRELLNLKFANNIRLSENDDLPRNNQIGQKTSNFFSEISYKPTDFLSAKYNNSIKNNLSEISYENLSTELKINNFVTSFDYLNENNTSDKNSYLTNTTSYSVNDFNNFSFSTRENKTANLTEYYKLIYQYKNDCLAASIEYNKEYYTDRELKPNESIFLKLTIIPFGETSSPNLKN